MYTQIYTVNEVAEWLKISPSELRKLMTLKQITYFEIGEKDSLKRRKRFRYIDVIRYIRDNLIKSGGTLV